MKIKDNTVLVTGGCSGIGKIMARICLEKGARQVVIWDINEQAIKATVKELAAGQRQRLPRRHLRPGFGRHRL